MIPSYNEKINILPVQPKEQKNQESLEEIHRLSNTVNALKEQVNYLMRENDRLKADLDSVKYKVNRS
jgi:regulator of replication initiation timing